MAFMIDSGSDEQVMADINVTPLVDVMLVLLIIFMVTAPMLHQGVEVALPQTEAENLPQRVEDPIVLTMNENELVFIRETPVHPTQLVDRLLPLLEARGDESVLLKADRNLPYGKVIDLLALLHRGGITNVGMVTEEPRSR
ncbi:MAG: ExbD/TolR family protein [Thermoanaerobaculia bacterium]|nr:ExbD/TolR family protein [Thermoanaerobaculia bacterium]